MTPPQKPGKSVRCAERCGLLRCIKVAGHVGLHACYNPATGEYQAFNGATPSVPPATTPKT